MIAFIDDHREAHGVEPICKVLPIAPSTYHDHVAKRTDPAKLSARAKRTWSSNRRSNASSRRTSMSMARGRSGGRCCGRASQSHAARSSG
jgi:hypothetical protein